MRSTMAPIVALVLAAVTAGVVFALNYEGEDFCQEHPAWPGGTYLGQMHPYHADFYRGYAERRGWDPCVTWAADQRNSAIRGLRELGYTVSGSDQVLTEPIRQFSGTGPGLTEEFELDAGNYLTKVSFRNNISEYGRARTLHANLTVFATQFSRHQLIASSRGDRSGSGVEFALVYIDEESIGKASIRIDAQDRATWNIHIFRL